MEWYETVLFWTGLVLMPLGSLGFMVWYLLRKSRP